MYDSLWHLIDPWGEEGGKESGKGSSSVLFNCHCVAKYGTYLIKEFTEAFVFQNEEAEIIYIPLLWSIFW